MISNCYAYFQIYNWASFTRDTIQRKVDKISSCKVFDVFKKPVDGKQKNFRDFHHDIMENQKKHIDFLVSEYEEMGPLLMKVEEILVSSRSKSHPRLASYYSFWEGQMYKAVINFIKINLDDLLDIMHSRVPLFKVSVLTRMMTIQSETMKAISSIRWKWFWMESTLPSRRRSK